MMCDFELPFARRNLDSAASHVYSGFLPRNFAAEVELKSPKSLIAVERTNKPQPAICGSLSLLWIGNASSSTH